MEHNVLDINKGTTSILNERYILSLLMEYYELLEEFNQEKDKNNIDVLKKYLNKVNDLF